MISQLRYFFSHCFIIRAFSDERYGYAAAFVALTILIIQFFMWLYRFHYVDRLKERCILVTGCDSGFGEKLCLKLDSMGCQVFACCLTNKGIENLINLCSNNVRTFLLDIRDSVNVGRVVDEVKHELKGRRLWGLVNNVGVCGPIGPMEFLQKKDFKEILDVNFLGALDMTIRALPLMKADSKEKARIVNMTSILGTFHTPYSAAYCISKNALNIFSHILSVELIGANIEVIVIEPGAHSTNLTGSIDSSIQACWERMSEEDRKKYGKKNFDKIIFLGSTFLKIFNSRNLNRVISAYCHALFSRRPRTRYMIGTDAFLMNLASYIPKPLLKTLYAFSGLLARSPPK